MLPLKGLGVEAPLSCTWGASLRSEGPGSPAATSPPARTVVQHPHPSRDPPSCFFSLASVSFPNILGVGEASARGDLRDRRLIQA